MTFVAQLRERLADKHLLNHPFYQAWSQGQLTQDHLRTYARQYYHHVLAFPRYVSATHSNCESVEGRQLLVENLVDEDRGPENHPELWLRFAEGLGEQRDTVKTEALLPETKNLIETFMGLSRASYAEGLGALFAYEQQVPAVADSKIQGLKKFYGIDAERAVQFFTVHQTADVYHSEACAQLMDQLSDEDKQRCQAAAEKAAAALWGFLDGMTRVTGVSCAAH